MRPTSFGALREAIDAKKFVRRSVKNELRENLIAKLRDNKPLFPGIIG